MIQLLEIALLLTFPAMMILGGIRDLTSYTIPNWISFGVFFAFFPCALIIGLPLHTLGVNLGVGILALTLGVVMFALGWIGGGDAKLFAAAGLWLGFPSVISFIVYAGFAGGLLSMSLMGMRSLWLRRYLVGGPAWLERLATHGEKVPYGVAIAAGSLIAFPSAALMEKFSATL